MNGGNDHMVDLRQGVKSEKSWHTYVMSNGLK